MLTMSQKRDLIDAKVTLNDKPAAIRGYALDFAVVRNVDGQSAEWAWETVKRIVDRDGRFYL